MSDDDLPAIPELFNAFAAGIVRRGRASVNKRLGATRSHLERRQLEQDRQHFWVRLGKTAYQLANDGDIDHPAIRKAVQRIKALEQQLSEMDATDASSEVAQ
ncbi:MAG: hypothetical protein ACJAZO_003488 [Myxococcota bacterium]|jgi:hypothetical protein